jgi:transposase
VPSSRLKRSRHACSLAYRLPQSHYTTRLNANLLRRWVADREELDEAEQARASMIVPTAEFVPLQLGSAETGGAMQDIVIGVRRGAATVTVRWPAAAAAYCATWLHGAGCGDPDRCHLAGNRAVGLRAGTDTALARVVKVFGAVRPHHAYLFANKRATRMKVLVYDGLGIWLAVRRLNKGRFVWTDGQTAMTLPLNRDQLQAIVSGPALEDPGARPRNRRRVAYRPWGRKQL